MPHKLASSIGRPILYPSNAARMFRNVKLSDSTNSTEKPQRFLNLTDRQPHSTLTNQLNQTPVYSSSDPIGRTHENLAVIGRYGDVWSKLNACWLGEAIMYEEWRCGVKLASISFNCVALSLHTTQHAHIAKYCLVL